MTDQQRKGIEILNEIKSKNNISDDDYYFLLSFIIDGPTYLPQIVPVPYQPPIIQPYYGQQYEVTCKVTKDNQTI